MNKLKISLMYIIIYLPKCLFDIAKYSTTSLRDLWNEYKFNLSQSV